MIIDFEPEEYFRIDQLVTGQLAIHSPWNILNPFAEGFTIKPNKIYVIQIKEDIKNLLPYPYQTNCTDYIKAWKTRGQNGPLSKEYIADQETPLSSLPHPKLSGMGWRAACSPYAQRSIVKHPWRVVGRLEGGQTEAEVAQAIGVSQSVISRIWNRFLETGSTGRRPGQGRRRATTPNEDRYLVLTARRHQNMNATLLLQHLRSATGTTVSTQIVRNRLHGLGLYAHRPMVCVRLTSRHRRDRWEWAIEHVNWRRNEWSNVLFLTGPVFLFIRIIGVFSCAGTVAVGIILHLYIIRDGPLTARRYRDEILRPIVVPYAAAIGDDFILMDDNCRPHHANLVEDLNRTNGMASMFSKYESNRACLGRSRKTSCWPPTTPQTIQELERALLEEWDRIPQLVINSLIDSMPQSGSTAHGGPWPSQEPFPGQLSLPASVLQFLVLKTRRSFSRSLIHLRFGMPFGWALETFLVVWSSSILTT
ncbi:transposable element Tcb2 transposase [Trichonephila clavipes]|nr:transposable element Tcb2 transposase [Trichonephila clavipes]